MGADEFEDLALPSQGVIVREMSILSANEVANRIHAAREAGYRKAIADLRDRESYVEWLRTRDPLTDDGWLSNNRAADFLESRLTKEGESDAE